MVVIELPIRCQDLMRPLVVIGVNDHKFAARLDAGINNLSDQQPRLYSPNVQANTDPSLYDVLGRRYYVGVDYRL